MPMRLLLAEDDDLLRSTLKRDFERAGYAVDAAGDGEQAEFLGATEHYDAAVLDLGLPRLPGLRCCATGVRRATRCR
jgi:two-component system OmpR family response regulator